MACKPDPLRGLLWKSLLLYAGFLLPTLLAGFHAGWRDDALSRLFPEVWQANFWHFPGWLFPGWHFFGASSSVSRVLLDILSAAAIGGLALLFYQGFRLLRDREEPLSKRQKLCLLAWPILCGLLLIPVIPFHSSDLYGYLNRGFQQSVAHTNPYLVTVAEIPGWRENPLFHAHWIDNPCPYGFFFAQLTAFITRWSGWGGAPSFFGAFLGMKILNWFCLIGATLLIARLGGRLGLKRPWLAAWLFGANPLVLLHAIGNGHNDILLAFLLLASLWSMENARWRWASLPLLMLSILTKYASLLALPFVLIGLVKKRDVGNLLAGLTMAVFGVALLAMPYVDPGRSWPWSALLDNAGKPQHSIIDMLAGAVAYPIHWMSGVPAGVWRKTISGFLKPWFWGGFLLFYLREVWRQARGLFHQAKDAEVLSDLSLIRSIGLTMTVMVAGVSAKFHPWYVIMFLPVLLLLPECSRLRRFGLTLSLFQLAGFTVFQNLPVFSPLLLTGLPLLLAVRNAGPFSPAESRAICLKERSARDPA